MSFEESYKFATDMANMFITEEEIISKNVDKTTTIYSNDHPLYSLMSFVYPNLFIESNRDEYDKIINNQIRAQQLVRIRICCLSIIALTGAEFVNKITQNIIDGICLNSGESKPRTLRRELEVYFRQRPNTWFCVLASSSFNNKLVKNSKYVNPSQTISPGTARSIRTSGVVL